MEESPLIGRERELAGLEAALDERAAVALEGEPGIGKSRLLGELAAQAQTRGWRVAGARASEAELDLPYAVITEALVPALRELGEHRLDRLGLEDPGPLAGFLPPLAALAQPDAAADAHRIHRALRDLLGVLAAGTPLALWLDDVHWADPASAAALAALLRRPPTGDLVLALAFRAGQAPRPVAAAVGAALRDGTLRRIVPRPLDEVEAVALHGPGAAEAYADSGGNPFYLEQLAKPTDPPRASLAGEGEKRAGAHPSHLAGIPDRVAGALAAELDALSPSARVLLDAAAVAGDPFDAELAAAVAELDPAEAPAAVDELAQRTLIRSSPVPGRFAFRHPVVRRAVYDVAPAGWRLAAHGRAARALEARGAGPVACAHHVEHAARPGDEAAIGLLERAASELQVTAPASAVRMRAAALRLLPATEDERRRELAILLADAQSAAGDPAAGRATLLALMDGADAPERIGLGVRVANLEYWLGRHDDARARYHVALQALPAEPSPDRVRLHLGTGLSMLLTCDFTASRDHAADARDDARALGDPVLEAAALSMEAAAATALDPTDPAPADAGAAAFAALTDAQALTRLPGLWMLARAERALGRLGRALAHLERGSGLARASGRTSVLLTLRAETVPVLVELGRMGAAVEAGEEATELTQLLGAPPLRLWAWTAVSRARLAAGDATGALAAAEEAANGGRFGGFQANGQPGWAHGAALAATGHADQGAAEILVAAGGPGLPELPPSERPAAIADLVDAHLAAGDIEAARAAFEDPEPGNAWARATLARARAEVLLAEDDAKRAASEAAQAIEAARAGEAARASKAANAAPWVTVSARARLVEGRALAALGDRDGARVALVDAAQALERAGAERWRGVAARELRTLGHRVRRDRAATDGALTDRERAIAELAAGGSTNREIAEELVLSVKTVEAHLRNIFAKLGVRRRVELTRALAREYGSEP